MGLVSFKKELNGSSVDARLIEQIGVALDRCTQLNNLLVSITEKPASEKAELSKGIPGMVHDFMSTLVTINGIIDEIGVREKHKIIYEATAKYMKALNNVMGTFDLLQGKAGMKQVNINEVISEAVRLVRDLCEPVKNKKVVCAYADNLPEISANPEGLNDVIENLLINASHAINDSENAENGEIKVTTMLDAEGGYVLIKVGDNGTGIEPELLPPNEPNIFTPKFTTKEEGKGTGLGLSIVRKIVEMHGGTIEAKNNEDGQGTTFTIKLPIKLASNHEVLEMLQKSKRLFDIGTHTGSFLNRVAQLNPRAEKLVGIDSSTQPKRYKVGGVEIEVRQVDTQAGNWIKYMEMDFYDIVTIVYPNVSYRPDFNSLIGVARRSLNKQNGALFVVADSEPYAEELRGWIETSTLFINVRVLPLPEAWPLSGYVGAASSREGHRLIIANPRQASKKDTDVGGKLDSAKDTATDL